MQSNIKRKIHKKRRNDNVIQQAGYWYKHFKKKLSIIKNYLLLSIIKLLIIGVPQQMDHHNNIQLKQATAFENEDNMKEREERLQ